MNNMALVLSWQGKYDEALKLQQSLAILVKQLGPEHSDVSCTKSTIGKLQRYVKETRKQSGSRSVFP